MLDTNHRAQISQGFTTMVLFMITMTVTWFLSGLADGSMQEQLRSAEGVSTKIRGYTLFFSFDILMAFLVCVIDHRIFRWAVFVGAVLWTGYFSYLVVVAEAAGYLAEGWHMFAMGTVRNLIGLYVCYAAYRWARVDERASTKEVAV